MDKLTKLASLQKAQTFALVNLPKNKLIDNESLLSRREKLFKKYLFTKALFFKNMVLVNVI